jgi:hypothetical protein
VCVQAINTTIISLWATGSCYCGERALPSVAMTYQQEKHYDVPNIDLLSLLFGEDAKSFFIFYFFLSLSFLFFLLFLWGYYTLAFD